jgi:hypothetical protein
MPTFPQTQKYIHNPRHASLKLKPASASASAQASNLGSAQKKQAKLCQKFNKQTLHIPLFPAGLCTPENARFKLKFDFGSDIPDDGSAQGIWHRGIQRLGQALPGHGQLGHQPARRPGGAGGSSHGVQQGARGCRKAPDQEEIARRSSTGDDHAQLPLRKLVHQGQAAAQQARPTSRAKPKNWIFMSKSQRKHWFESALKIDKRKQR